MAVPTLEALARAHTVVAVLTAPDKPVGRRRVPTPTPVASRAEELGIPTLKPEHLRSQARTEVAEFAPELLVCVAYARIFGPRFLALFPCGGINVHPSALPLHRGPSPIPATILSGAEMGAISVQTIAPEMDTGNILVVDPLPIDEEATTEDVVDRVAHAAPDAVLRAIDAVRRGDAGTPQNHSRATYTSIITTEDARIDWTTSAIAISRAIRAYHPWPGAFTTLDGARLVIRHAIPIDEERSNRTGEPPRGGTVTAIDRAHGILVQTGEGLLAVDRLQRAGKRELGWRDFVNGRPDLIGVRLGEDT